MQTVGRKFLRGHDRDQGKRENGDRSFEILYKIQTILQKPMLGDAKLATVREKCLASQDIKRENCDRPSEMLPIMRTIRQKFNIGNAKIVTVRQKYIASQHRKRQNGDRS